MKILARFAIGSLLVLLLALATGCIRSHVLITSDPVGADVKFQGKDVGKTPVDVAFIWYWYYDIDVTKEGFQPVHKIEYFRTPPYAYFPLDFFAELLPFSINDKRERDYKLVPVPQP